MAKKNEDNENIKRLAQGFMAKVRPPPLKARKSITTDTGWLSPEGLFYPCRYYEHQSVAERLFEKEREKQLKENGFWKGATATAEEQGWVHIQDQGGTLGVNFNGFHCPYLLPPGQKVPRPTRVQIRLVKAYCRAHEGTSPPWWAAEPKAWEESLQKQEQEALRVGAWAQRGFHGAIPKGYPPPEEGGEGVGA